VKVHAPNEQFSGEVAGVVFTDGVGELDPKKSPGAESYFERHGYGLGKKAAAADAPATTDSRDYSTPTVVGTPLRDAAVDPWPEDFLPPTNAGSADPHGPDVVSPGIHALPPTPIVPGPATPDDPDRQEAAQTDAATATLVEGQPATEVTGEADPAPTGPLGLSDPASAEQGEADAKAQQKAAKKTRATKG
jgi:hypothetical protein